jgi:3'(2'), 5'-bisphosphate nucleotidase
MNDANIVLSDLIKTIREAGNRILDVYNNSAQSFQSELKKDLSPLTLADKASNEYICHQLEKLFPDIPILSEENKEIPYEARKSFNLFWLIDPLDGTKEFLKRNGEFTVNLALVKFGRPILGIVHVPCSNKTYFAEKGKGAWLMDAGKKEIKLQVSEFDLINEGLRIVASRSHLNDETLEYLRSFKNPKLISMGSSLKFMLVAEGKADVYPRLGPTMEWDTAAAQIIVEEAGGKVLEFQNMKPLVYNKKNLLNPFFLVFGK